MAKNVKPTKLVSCKSPGCFILD